MEGISHEKLSSEESDMIAELDQIDLAQQPRDRENQQYYQGQQPINFLGLRLREEWLHQAFPLSWCRTLVNVVVERQQVLRLLRRGKFTEDEHLRLTWDRSDMDSQLPRLASNLAIYSRAYTSVAMGVDGHPRLVVEPVRAISMLTDPLGRTLAAQRKHWDRRRREVGRVLYLPDQTILIGGEGDRSRITRNHHWLGRVPVVMSVIGDVDEHLVGQPVFEALKPLADTSAETLLNARVALESAASPTKVLLDAAMRIEDEDGNQVEAWEAFYDSMLQVFSSQDETGKAVKADVKQLPGADMSQFIKTVEMLGQQASGASGLPMRMLGHVTANPPSEMTVRGEEARLVRLVETHNDVLGASLGWALSISERLRTGQWPDDGAIDISWRDPGTPTHAQLADALVKMVQVQIMSRRSALEEMGWSDARINREMERLAEENREDDFFYRDLGRPAGGEVL